MQTKKLWEICGFQNGFAFKSHEYVENWFFVMRIKNVQDWYINLNDPQYISKDRKNEFEKFILQEWDILMSLTGNIWRAGVVKKEHLPALLNQRVAKISIKDETILDQKYLFSFFNSSEFSELVCSLGSWAAQQNIGLSTIANLEIPLPPLATQHAIAEKLDKLQSLIDLKKQAITKTDELAKSIFLEMFGDPMVNEKDWEVKKLKEIWRLASWWTPSRWTPAFFTWTIPWITTVSLWKTFISRENAVEYITEEAIKNSATKLVPKNSILIWTRVWVWKVSINVDDISYNQDITWITEIDKSLNLLFFREFLSYKSASYNDVKRWATIQWITSDVIKNTNVYIPPLPLQQKFADIITQIESTKEKNKQALAKLEELYQATMQRSFSL